jgi:hypothetical protein
MESTPENGVNAVYKKQESRIKKKMTADRGRQTAIKDQRPKTKENT